MNQNIVLQRSATSMWINTVGLSVSLTLLLFVNVVKVPVFPVTLAVLCLTAYASPIIILEWKFLSTYNNISTGLKFYGPANTFNIQRILIKLLGLYVTFLFAGFYYWVIPHYSDPIYYQYFDLLRSTLPILFGLSIPYFIIVDRYLSDPRDVYWQMGQLCLLNLKFISLKTLLQHLLGWLVKLFFLPLMFTYFFELVLFFQATSVLVAAIDFNHFFEYAFKVLIYIDLLIGTAGYIITLRIFDSHIRTTEPTFLGWFVALQCYQPFSELFQGRFLNYNTENYWGYWLVDYPLAYLFWGCLILALTTIYVWSSLPFGIRFSNLTHRGIITNGPYKFCKHPAYLSKNISWWLISLPFLSTVSVADAAKHSLLLLMVNLVYLLRARTEERHLSWDIDYIKYAEYIEQRGMMRWLGQWVPFLKFKKNRLFNISV